MDNLKQNPMAMIFAMSIEANMVIVNQIQNLITKYEANGIDVIPVSEIQNCFKTGIEKSTKEDSLVSKLLKEAN